MECIDLADLNFYIVFSPHNQEDEYDIDQMIWKFTDPKDRPKDLPRVEKVPEEKKQAVSEPVSERVDPTEINPYWEEAM